MSVMFVRSRARNLARYGSATPSYARVIRTWQDESIARIGSPATAALYASVAARRRAERERGLGKRVLRVLKAGAIGVAGGIVGKALLPWYGQLVAGVVASLVPSAPVTVAFNVGMFAAAPLIGAGSLIAPLATGKLPVKSAIAAGLGGLGLSRFVRGGALAGLGLGLAGGMYVGYKLFKGS